ncbi:filamentous haemagglutinin family protein, partial [Pelomonas sp. KK5]|uniref:filamentous haemagglutinin family protein n=1 Tax=Pelomonas sp. KK5 TaxID=1855730 RepID=UPI00117FF9D1
PDPFPAASLPVNLPTIKNQKILVDGTSTPFLDGGGAISVKAGRDVVGATPAAADSVTSWAWRTQVSGTNGAAQSVWFSRYDLFRQGIATFGGGSVQVTAGHDLINVRTAAANNGWVINGTGGAASQLQQFGGGSVYESAGHDIVNGSAYAAGALLQVKAGGRITTDAASSNDSETGLQLVYQDGEVRVSAARDLSVGYAASFANLMAESANGTASLRTTVTGLSNEASLRLQSTAGDVSYLARRQPLTGNSQADALGAQLPGDVSLEAPAGSVNLLGGVTQIATQGGGFRALAGQDLNLQDIVVTAAGAAPAVAAATRTAAIAAQGNTTANGAGGLDTSDRSPVDLAAAAGDVTVDGSGISSARPVRMTAGQDIVFVNGSGLVAQHQPQQQSEMTLVQAGRDVVLGAGNGGVVSRIQVAGPGDLVVLAGRNIDLGVSAGVSSIGNSGTNANGLGPSPSVLLPSTGADITMVAGIRADGSDYLNATKQGFALLGVSGLAGHAGDLYALLAGASSANSSFNAMNGAQQLAALQQLLGTGAYTAALGSYAQSLPTRADATEQAIRMAALLGTKVGDARVAEALKQTTAQTQPLWSSLTPDQARAAFGMLAPAQQATAVLPLLAQAFAALPAQARYAAFGSWASTAQQQALAAYVRKVTGEASLSDAAAAQRFESLPLERQAVWLNGVLVGELRSAGRAAAKATDDAAQAADYARGYQAINLLFPLGDAGRPGGSILMPTSQVKTAMNAGIALLTPGGGVDAGQVASTGQAKNPSQLGIVTLDGGDIAGVVRDNLAVNQSRIFTVGSGDLLLWSSEGNIDAGRGAKTVVGAPAPVLRLDATGHLYFDTSGSFSGSGIAVLNAGSELDLYAPSGAISAGEAGIRSAGNAFFGAKTFINTFDFSVGGSSAGAPPPAAPPAPVVAPGANNALAATSAGTAAPESDEDARKKRRSRRQLLLEFLGFGNNGSSS